MHRLPPVSYLQGNTLLLEVGQSLDIDNWRMQLESAGYRHADNVYEHGEYAVRGAILDIFPMGATRPYRIDLFDDEIETLRTFDPETQRSIDRIERIELLPANEFPWHKEARSGSVTGGLSSFPMPIKTPRSTRTSPTALHRRGSSTTCPCSSTRPQRSLTTCPAKPWYSQHPDLTRPPAPSTPTPVHATRTVATTGCVLSCRQQNCFSRRTSCSACSRDFPG